MLLLSVALSLVLKRTLARSTPRDPEHVTVGWVQNPNGRGTTGIIVSCVLKLGLYVWSAMHLNIPPKGESSFRYRTRSAKWVLLGILIPELVVLCAWRQWLSARRMSLELNKILANAKREAQTPRRNIWTIQHSYYAGMGGYVFDQDRLPQGEAALFESHDRLTLTASGVLLLAECGCLPDLDRDSIWDKSKADSLGKALVCLQAAWMIFQTVGRLVAHQPITLLEVNTLDHIFCAFVIYVLWWNKTKEVHAPTILEGRSCELLAAYIYMSSRISGQKLEGLVVLSKWIKPELSQLGWYPKPPTPVPEQAMDGSEAAEKPENDEPIEKEPRMTAEVSVSSDQSSTGSLLSRPVHTVTLAPRTVVKTRTPTAQELRDDVTRSNRHLACAQAIDTFPAVRSRFQPTESELWFKPDISHLVTPSAGDWPSDFYLPGISGELMGMALWLSSSLYGGIHIAAWAEFFPTEAEKLLWRFSATYIASSGLFWLVLCVVAFRWPFASQYWDRFIELRAWKIEYALLGFAATCCGVAYIFARVFLVIDAVVSLRVLPNAAYQTPDWTTIFPHF